jgi:hypothetical protein
MIQNKEKSTEISINKCWNIIRFICDNQDYSAELSDYIEVEITPLLKCIE